MKKITATVLSLAALAVLALGTTLAGSKGGCCDGSGCCNGSACCRAHHK
jgi:hypothetical protein